MLSISKAFKGAGQGDYYLALAREDYYLEGGEPPGRWLGRGSRALGLSGTVEAVTFRNLLQGFTPDGQRPLVHNAGSENRRGGWDLTWSAPKSVSIAWSQAPGAIRQEIQDSLHRAVEAGIGYLETAGAVSRRGAEGIEREGARLVFAAFEHGTSRAQDPQLHVHTVLVNTGVREDGSTGTLDPREIYRHQLAAGTLFRAELAVQLEERLGLRARRAGRAFELIGVDRDLIEVFSRRRAEIEATLRAWGLSGAKAAEAAVFATREAKQSIPRSELFARWQAVGREQHWTARELAWLMEVPYPQRNPVQEGRELLGAALRNLTDRWSHFSARELTQALAQEGQGRGVGASGILSLGERLLQGRALVGLGLHRGEAQWTTPEVLELERVLLAAAAAMHQGERSIVASPPALDRIGERHPELSDEQRAAVRHVCEATGGLRVVSGMAGTGKSTLFAVAHEVWGQQGRVVHGACLAGKAAAGLMEATGIPSATLHRTLREIEAGRLRLDRRSVLVVDEAAMVGTRQLARLVEASRDAGATLILCGDARQLQAIEAGGGFDALARRYGAAELTEIRRQRAEWARQAVRDFAAGQAAKALVEFEARGLLSISAESADAMASLVARWRKVALIDPKGTVILATTNADVYRLNALAQFERLQAGAVSGTGVALGCERIFDGDRVVFTRNADRYGVFNGDLGTVLAVTERQIAVGLDRGRTVFVGLAEYRDLRLAYALTVHKAQGMSAEAAFVLVDPRAQDRESGYVQASRARGETRFYVAGEDGGDLERSLTRSRQKHLASTIAAGPELVLTLSR